MRSHNVASRVRWECNTHTRARAYLLQFEDLSDSRQTVLSRVVLSQIEIDVRVVEQSNSDDIRRAPDAVAFLAVEHEREKTRAAHWEDRYEL